MAPAHLRRGAGVPKAMGSATTQPTPSDIMPTVRRSRPEAMISLLLACSALMSACGGGGDDDVFAADAAIAPVTTPTDSATVPMDLTAKSARTLPVPAWTSTVAAVTPPPTAARPEPAQKVGTRIVGTPYVEIFEPLASDASGSATAGVLPNHWGGHQSRVTVHRDGTVRALILVKDGAGNLAWRLMKRAAAENSAWAVEGSAETQDDAVLLRDPVSDAALVVAWPASVPTVYATPTLTGRALPGTWQVMGKDSRHYSGAGIAADGTLCLKASVELPTAVPTSNTDTTYLCGKPGPQGGTGQWLAQQTRHIGDRHAYDYLFPTVVDGSLSLVATATRDLYKTAAGLPDLAGFPYVFNGTRQYVAGASSSARWSQADIVEPLPTPANATASPLMWQVDGLLDSRQRLLVVNYADSPTDASVRGFHFKATNLAGTTLASMKLGTLPPYGKVRLFEDARKRLWLLHSNAGTTQSELTLYRVDETTDGDGRPAFSLSGKTDLSEAAYPYAIEGSPMLAVARGGNDGSLAIDGLFAACATPYVRGTAFSSASCYGSDGRGTQRVFHFRIRLPD